MSLPLALVALLAVRPGHAADDLDDLLKSIPDIENPDAKPKEEPKQPDVPFTAYVDQVRKQVLAQWKPKTGAIKKNPNIETRLVLIVDASGAVTDLKALQLSGDKKYDDKAVDAVNAAGDLPPPPPNLVSLAAEGVVVNFNGKDYLRSQ